MSTWRIRFEPLITPFFRAFWRISRGMTLGVRGLVTDAHGRVLLVRHTYKTGWYLPGGGVERGQTAEEALHMELREEAGVVCESAPVLIGLYSNHRHHPNDHVALFRVDQWRQENATALGEIAETGFFAPDAPPAGTTEATKRRIAEVIGGAPRSAHW